MLRKSHMFLLYKYNMSLRGPYDVFSTEFACHTCLYIQSTIIKHTKRRPPQVSVQCPGTFRESKWKKLTKNTGHFRFECRTRARKVSVSAKCPTPVLTSSKASVLHGVCPSPSISFITRPPSLYNKTSFFIFLAIAST